jgi:hypothetical protein
MKIEMTSTVDISVELLAKLFAELDDDAQCKFFVEAAKHGEQWGEFKAEQQWQRVGGHLRNCKCSTEAARELIRSIAYAMENSNHGIEPVDESLASAELKQAPALGDAAKSHYVSDSLVAA